LTLVHEVSNQFVCLGIANHGPARNLKYDVFARCPVHLLTCSSLARISLEVLAIAIIDQSIQIGSGLHIDTSSTATISAVRSAQGRKFLAAEVNRTIPSITRFDKNFCMIVKHVPIFPENDILRKSTCELQIGVYHMMVYRSKQDTLDMKRRKHN